MIRNISDAEDEVQNAFWKAFQRLDQFRGDGSFGAWLNRIVENQCLMRIREERNSRFVYLDESSDSNDFVNRDSHSPHTRRDDAGEPAARSFGGQAAFQDGLLGINLRDHATANQVLHVGGSAGGHGHFPGPIC